MSTQHERMAARRARERAARMEEKPVPMVPDAMPEPIDSDLSERLQAVTEAKKSKRRTRKKDG